MKILAIETSCDETGISILEVKGDTTSATFTIKSHALLSQIELHRQYGGVFPAMAKREHAKNLVPLLENALEEAEMYREDAQSIPEDIQTRIGELLSREADMAEVFHSFISETEKPALDAIAVTYGPGLEPALWVGVNFAQALALAWNIPLVPVDHMEGHFLVALATRISDTELTISETKLPVLGLLISGGHTEIDLMAEWNTYTRLGQTRDDAVGEAFDKVARMMDLPYPGGPEISRLAEKAREDNTSHPFSLPRPMIDTPNYDFSFSGLKTAVLYLIKEKGDLTQEEKEELAWAFEDAVSDVLIKKTLRALEETAANTLAIGGGVSASIHIQRAFTEAIQKHAPHVSLRFPPSGLTGDNGVMIGIAGFYRMLRGETVEPGTLVANGNLSLA